MTSADRLREISGEIIAEISKTVVGKDEIKELLLIALLSGGHVLIEGLPGTGKTTVARTFARTIGGEFKRIQGTPDMLPADILGFYLYRPEGTSTFMPGPIFANVLMADELNRTAPRTQAALLEAMQEHQVTIERETHMLDHPFVVVASQVPYGGTGTSPLSEVQIDRFMFRVWSGFPSPEEEADVLKNIDDISEPHVATIASIDDIVQIHEEVKKVHVADALRRYIVEVVNRLRNHPDVMVGPSPRGSIALFRGARGKAFIEGRDYILPDDIKDLLLPALAHRIRVSAEAEMENVTAQAIVEKIATEVPVPTVEHG
ncbi:MAG: MoxR family ATPase [Chloroflexi bacterium]|nr:MoxR family ATPase [Chloroflexota bacterium]